MEIIFFSSKKCKRIPFKGRKKKRKKNLVQTFKLRFIHVYLKPEELQPNSNYWL
jgi:hypothetical protein